jgi:mono/diheme cytochrome c family protein
MDIGSYFMPLGGTNGTTNAVMFGVALMWFRDAQLNLVDRKGSPRMVHHDMDAPPWWNFRKRKQIYIDGFAQKGSRALMQFMLVRENGPEKFHEWEADYQDVFAYLESLEPPKFPFAIDSALAEKGRLVFNRQCAECHGTYGPDGAYPGRRVPIDELGTDRTRLDALSPEHRRRYGASWFAEFGRQQTIADPGGYVAPPLDGIWASAPYLHNGSVPTLWHLMNPRERPVVWSRSETGYDAQRVGLQVEVFDEVPQQSADNDAARRFFDTRKFGKRATGHDFPDALSVEEKKAVLEYLKTL